MAKGSFFSRKPTNTNSKRTDNKRRLELFKSYAPDWVLTITLAGVFFALNNVHGFRRAFSVDDESIRFPYTVHERVPDWALYLIAFVSPIVIQICTNIITIRSFWDFHNSVLGLVLSLSMTGVITQFSKITTGRPRPDLLSRCIPISGSQDPTYGLLTDSICTQTDQSIMIDGWRSFPSGHSSLSFAGLGFLSFYLAGKMHLFDKRGHTHKAWISVTPLAGATLVAISRTMDYRHHWQDVVAGSLLGAFVAYFAYRQYYPSLTSLDSHRPYSPRVPRDEQEVLPTVASHGGSGYPRESEEVKLIDGAVCKPEPEPLEEIWHRGDSPSGNPVGHA